MSFAWLNYFTDVNTLGSPLFISRNM